MIDRSDCWQRLLVAGELTSVPRPDDDNDVDDVIPELGLVVATDRWGARPDSARLKNLQHPRSVHAKVPSLRGDPPFLQTIHGLHHAPGEAERIP